MTDVNEIQPIRVQVGSEIGRLEAVILHTPGSEIENMTPENVERALYSDILNRSVALKEYAQFEGVLNMVTQTLQVKDLLVEALTNEFAKNELIDKICKFEHAAALKSQLLEMPPSLLGDLLIEGIPIERNSLTNFLNPERYALRPLHNFFFTRDASVSIQNHVLINKMANKVRDRESWIMDTIFTHSKRVHGHTISPATEQRQNPKITIEGGDILVARHDTLIVGLGMRTSAQGIDYIIDHLVPHTGIQHLIVQELPHTPESFIHLDMVFTLLDHHKCMVFEPLILKSTRYQTIYIQIDNGKVTSIQHSSNLLAALKSIGIELETVYCGGSKDPWIQEREQWHSGANFFAFAPGKIIGYERNIYTVEELSKHGFEVLKANDVIQQRIDLSRYSRCVVTIEGAELARGGGGARCMTMPVRRELLQV